MMFLKQQDNCLGLHQSTHSTNIAHAVHKTQHSPGRCTVAAGVALLIAAPLPVSAETTFAELGKGEELREGTVFIGDAVLEEDEGAGTEEWVTSSSFRADSGVLGVVRARSFKTPSITSCSLICSL